MAIAALLVGLLAGVAFSESERNRLEDELADAAERRHHIEEELGGLRGRLKELDHVRASLDAERRKLVADITALELELDGLRDGVALPDFTGTHLAQARSRVEHAGWGLEVTHAESAAPPGTVLGQSPPAGSLLAPHSTVHLTVAAPEPTTWATLYTFQGQGRQATEPFELPDVDMGRLRLTYTFTNADSTSIVLYDADGQDAAVVVANTSPPSGTAMLDRAGTYQLDACCGTWHIQVQLDT